MPGSSPDMKRGRGSDRARRAAAGRPGGVGEGRTRGEGVGARIKYGHDESARELPTPGAYAVVSAGVPQRYSGLVGVM